MSATSAVSPFPFCSQCGKQSGRHDARFCDTCGEPFGAAAAIPIAAQHTDPVRTQFLADIREDLPENNRNDALLAVRIVLLLAAGFSAFTLPWLVAFFFFVAWGISLAWPKKEASDGR